MGFDPVAQSHTADDWNPQIKCLSIGVRIEQVLVALVWLQACKPDTDECHILGVIYSISLSFLSGQSRPTVSRRKSKHRERDTDSTKH